jgi:hypothetical protein
MPKFEIYHEADNPEPVNLTERPEDTARRYAVELLRLADGLADRGIALHDVPVEEAPVTTALAELDETDANLVDANTEITNLHRERDEARAEAGELRARSTSNKPTMTESIAGWNDAIHHLRIAAANPAIPTGYALAHAATFLEGLTNEGAPRVWAMPEEPGPDVSRVRDTYGQHFGRAEAIDEHGSEPGWLGETFATEADVPDLFLSWKQLMATHAPLTEVPACSTCQGLGEVHCAAHVAGDGCDQLRLTCPDCQGDAEVHRG